MGTEYMRDGSSQDTPIQFFSSPQRAPPGSSTNDPLVLSSPEMAGGNRCFASHFGAGKHEKIWLEDVADPLADTGQ
eukprot:1190194-Prorocentrum_minimum.AAC.5